jgi:flagellar FliJ protein
MPRFRFELQVVLEHRVRLEQQHQKVVADLEAKRVALEDSIRSCQQALETERAEARALLKAADIRGARLQAGAANRLVATAQRAVLELAGLLKRLETARAALLEAAKQRKAVELLKERRFEEWRYQQNHRENAEIDELAVMRAGRVEDLL